MGNKLCSIDSSTKKTGIAVYIDGTLSDYKLIDFSKVKDVEERTREMGRAILSYLDDVKPSLIYIEQPKGQVNVELVRKLSRILGIVMSWAITNDCYYEEVMPTVWRKYIPEFAQGKKNREELKAESLRVVKEKFNIEVSTDDEADAILIGSAMINRYTDEELF